MKSLLYIILGVSLFSLIFSTILMLSEIQKGPVALNREFNRSVLGATNEKSKDFIDLLIMGSVIYPNYIKK